MAGDPIDQLALLVADAESKHAQHVILGVVFDFVVTEERNSLTRTPEMSVVWPIDLLVKRRGMCETP
jgi:hypothetical protein